VLALDASGIADSQPIGIGIAGLGMAGAVMVQAAGPSGLAFVCGRQSESTAPRRLRWRIRREGLSRYSCFVRRQGGVKMNNIWRKL
jgi:hypothetical protein